MKKEHILNEIRRTADKETNQALGKARLEEETGIQEKDWSGIHWSKYSDAVIEAGCIPSEFNKAFEEERVVKQLIDIIDKKNKYPTKTELKLERRNNKDFPSHNVFGTKPKMAKKVVEYCEKNNVFPDVLEICRPLCKPDETNNVNEIDDEKDTEEKSGHVYMLEHDGVYRIGASIDAVQRHKQIRVQMPFVTKEIHVISTDDPFGIEAYWHKRFKDKKQKGKQKLQGDWFNLSARDIKAFKKRRKFM